MFNFESSFIALSFIHQYSLTLSQKRTERYVCDCFPTKLLLLVRRIASTWFFQWFLKLARDRDIVIGPTEKAVAYARHHIAILLSFVTSITSLQEKLISKIFKFLLNF